MTVIDRLNQLQRESGMTAKKLTEELGISCSSFTDWNKGRGKPKLETLIKFSNHFHVSLDWLVFGNVNPEKSSNIINLETSNDSENELLNKFRTLPPEYKSTVIAYLDGMLATLPKKNSNKKLSI